MIAPDLRPMARLRSMERLSDCLPLLVLPSRPFGPRSVPRKNSEQGTIVWAGICSTMTQSSLMIRWDGSH